MEEPCTDITSRKQCATWVRKHGPTSFLLSSSHSLENLEVGTEVVQDQTQCASISDQEVVAAGRSSQVESLDRGSLASLTEEEQEGDSSSIDSQVCPLTFFFFLLCYSMRGRIYILVIFISCVLLDIIDCQLSCHLSSSNSHQIHLRGHRHSAGRTGWVSQSSVSASRLFWEVKILDVLR